MQRNFFKKNAYNTGKSTASQELIYQHMSNHYRRILNAKKVVDTSPPYCYRNLRPLSGHIVPTLPSARSCKAKYSFLGKNASPVTTDRSTSTNSYSANTGHCSSSRYHLGCVEELNNANPSKKYAFDRNLTDRIAVDKKNAASSCCFSEDSSTNDKGVQSEKKLTVSTNIQKCKCSSSLGRTSKRRFHSSDNELAQKKVHAILVDNKNSSELPMDCTLELSDCKCRKICTCDAAVEIDTRSYAKKIEINQAKDQIQTSSRDSAYNGGVSSLPESRSPTPEGRIKNCSCNDRSNRNETYFKRGDKEKFEDRKFEDPEPSTTIYDNNRQRKKCQGLHTTNEDAFRKMKEDDLYTKFVEDITVEILEKCLYTNKALKKVMKKHVLNNLRTLDKNRMLKEVDNLRIRLEIPEDCSLFDLDVTTSSSYGDIVSAHSVISDSEFVLPDVDEAQKGKIAELHGVTENEKPESSVSSSIASAKTTKPLTCPGFDKEKLDFDASANKKLENHKKPISPILKSPVTQESDKYLSDESDISFGSNKNKKLVKERRIDGFRESSSEIEEDISEEISLETPDGDGNHALTKSMKITETSVSSLVHKKIRSVSFWNNGNNESDSHTTSKIGAMENKNKNGD